MKKLLFLIFFIFFSFACYAEEQPQSVFAKLKYQPDWDSYLTTNDFKENLKVSENNNLSYDNKGQKLSCKRNDFFRSLVLSGSSWLFDRDWSKDVYDDWFGNLRLPFVLSADLTFNKNIFNSELCNAFAYEHGCLGIKEVTGKPLENLKKIKNYCWDYDVIKTRLEDNNEQETNNLKSERSLCSNYLNQDTLKIKQINNSKLIEIDFNNDGKKELIYIANVGGKIYRGIFFDKIDEVKAFLKSPNNIIEYYRDFVNLLKRFEGLNTTNRRYLPLAYPGCEIKKVYSEPKKIFDDKYKTDKNLYSVLESDENVIYYRCDKEDIITKEERITDDEFFPYQYQANGFFHQSYDFDFFNFDEKTYYYYNDENNIYVLYKDENNKNIRVCLFAKDINLYNLEELSHNYIKTLIAKKIPLFQLNNDDYFYSEDLLEEIKQLFIGDLKLESKDYLFARAKEICNVDLYKLEKETTK